MKLEQSVWNVWSLIDTVLIDDSQQMINNLATRRLYSNESQDDWHLDSAIDFNMHN